MRLLNTVSRCPKPYEWDTETLEHSVSSPRSSALRVGEVAKCYYGQFSGRWSDYPSHDFPSRLHRVCSVPNRPRIHREPVANRWKIGQENSLGQSMPRLPSE